MRVSRYDQGSGFSPWVAMPRLVATNHALTSNGGASRHPLRGIRSSPVLVALALLGLASAVVLAVTYAAPSAQAFTMQPSVRWRGTASPPGRVPGDAARTSKVQRHLFDQLFGRPSPTPEPAPAPAPVPAQEVAPPQVESTATPEPAPAPVQPEPQPVPVPEPEPEVAEPAPAPAPLPAPEVAPPQVESTATPDPAPAPVEPEPEPVPVPEPEPKVSTPAESAAPAPQTEAVSEAVAVPTLRIKGVKGIKERKLDKNLTFVFKDLEKAAELGQNVSIRLQFNGVELKRGARSRRKAMTRFVLSIPES